MTGGTTPVVGEALRAARLRLVVRACLLWLLGIVLIATGVPVYVILPAYAILFLLVAARSSRSAPGTLLITRGRRSRSSCRSCRSCLDALPVWSTLRRATI